MCYEKKDWSLLNDHITLLCKRRAQLKKAIIAVVQSGMEFVNSDEFPDNDTKSKLIETLRTVSDGKIFVELERARLTKILAQMKEDDGQVSEAADILQEVQVETIGSMEVREKAAFLLDQIRLVLAKKDYIRAEIIARKVNTKTLKKDEELSDLKLKFYRLMIEFHVHKGDYLEVCQAYREVYNTKCIQDDEQEWKDALTHMVLYAALSPFDSDVSDILHRTMAEKKLAKLPVCHRLLTALTTQELIDWPLQDDAELRSYDTFSGMSQMTDEKADEGNDDEDEASKAGKRWSDLKKSIIQHNLRVVSVYYSRIETARLATSLKLTVDETEIFLSEMVQSKQLFAQIDRPAGRITFAAKKTPTQVLEDWGDNISKLLSLVDATCHIINKENMQYGVK